MRGQDPDQVPSDGERMPRLVTFTQISMLYAQEHWDVLKITIEPISFKSDEWFRVLINYDRDFVDRYAQALCEFTHMLHIPFRQRHGDPDLTRYVRQRKNRRSHAGPRWKSLLQVLLQGMILGHCDVDILLDLFFMDIPGPRTSRSW